VIILAIDPGTVISGVVGWDTDAKRVLEPNVWDNKALLDHLTRHPADSLAIEMIASQGMAVGQTTFETCVWIGHFEERWDQHHPELMRRRVYRHEVKAHLCGTQKAKDPNIRQALVDKFGDVGTKKNPGPLFGVKSHVWSALAVAITSVRL
jgi:hypothetical protein